LTMATAIFGLVVPAPARAADCPKDSVRAGTVCIDKYEASVWQIKPQVGSTNLSNQQQQVIDSIRAGNATLADLTKIGAVQLGTFDGNSGFVQNGCPVTGRGCTNIYAVSIPGVKPSAGVTWFQAAAAARNSYKRLPTNAEWTAAALGTPDNLTGADADDGTTTCNTATTSGGTHLVVNTGTRGKCVSDIGVFDMVGNLIEWVADWSPRGLEPAGTRCADNTWETSSEFHGYQCLVGVDTGADRDPGAWWRGGGTADGVFAGVYAISSLNTPSTNDFTLGFRAVR
jgi:hypothetical protein